MIVLAEFSASLALLVLAVLAALAALATLAVPAPLAALVIPAVLAALLLADSLDFSELSVAEVFVEVILESPCCPELATSLVLSAFLCLIATVKIIAPTAAAPTAPPIVATVFYWQKATWLYL